jgi:micrococcal nuclease
MISLGILIIASCLQLRAPSNPQPELAAVPTVTQKATGASSSLPQEPTSTVYFVTRVVDGDTIVVSGNGATTTVRLIGIDTPETVKPHTPVQCYGPEASKKAKEMLTGIFVHIETDPTQDTYDKYHRLLAYVFLPDGTSFNEYMVRNGYAREYTYDKPYHYQAQFKDDQKKAQQEKIGLWRACAF